MIKFKNFINSDKGYVIILVAGIIASFMLGISVGKKYLVEPETVTIEKPIYIEGETITKTQIAYVPKEVVVEKYIDSTTGKEIDKEFIEKTDIEANIGKQNVIVNLNGKEVEFKKTEDEKFVFDKNKIMLEQSNVIKIDATVRPVIIDKTNRWAIGIGKASGSGAAYTLDFPIGKSETFGGWIYKDDDNEAVGIKIKF